MVSRRRLLGFFSPSSSTPSAIAASEKNIYQPQTLNDIAQILTVAKQHQMVVADHALNSYLTDVGIHWWIDFSAFESAELFPQPGVLQVQPGARLANIRDLLQTQQYFSPFLDSFADRQDNPCISELLLGYTNFDERVLATICGIEVMGADGNLEWLSYFDQTSALHLQSAGMRQKISTIFEWQFHLQSEQLYSKLFYYFPEFTRDSKALQRAQLARLAVGSMGSLFLMIQLYLQVFPFALKDIISPMRQATQWSSEAHNLPLKLLWDPQKLFYTPTI